jgi:MFS family permease
MQSGFAIGYGLAAVVTALVLPRWGWRAVFFAGILPALLTLWIRRNVEESPRWLERQSGTSVQPSRLSGEVRTSKAEIREASRPSLFSVLSSGSRSTSPDSRPPAGGWGRLILITLFMNTAALFAWWGLFTWIPPYLSLPVEQGGRGLEIATTSLWIVVMQLGMWLGYVSFGFAGDAFGRKKTYMLYLFFAGALVPLYANADAAWSLLLLGPLVAFFGTGHFTGFGMITSDLFPTSFRVSAMGLTYNAGRALSASAPWLMGRLAEHASISSAFWLAGLGYLAAALLAARLPEPRRELLE